MVWKAVGWAVREASRKDEPAAFAFLLENRERMTNRLLSEAVKKLTAEHKVLLQG